MNMLVSHARSVEDCVLLVGGPGCTGKSYFASELASGPAGAGLKASVLGLDCYLLESAQREYGSFPINGRSSRAD
jgi:hypothetical protein